jgi:uncharacterized protein YcbK (DUF882 family)
MLPVHFRSPGPCDRDRCAGSPREGHPWRASARVLSVVTMIALLLGTPPAAGAADGQHTDQHTVSRGQTLYAIARRYRTTVDALREVNGLKPGQRIQPGLVLVIPERGREAVTTHATAKAELRSTRDKPTALRREPERRDAAGVSVGAQDAEPRKIGKKRGAKPGADAANVKSKGKYFTQKPKRPGWVRMVRGMDQLDLQLLTRQGRLVPKALPKLSRLMRASPVASIPIDPRLATLVGIVSNHFGGRTIRVVSGYRPYSPTQYTPHSNHNIGRAIDFVVEGVPNTVVRDFCRSFRNAGVGYYPNSTFVHLDVRSAKTYWVDYSRHGEPPRYDGTNGSLAADESTRDVPGAAEEEVYGSGDTHPHQSQPVEGTSTNQAIEDAPPAGGKNLGTDSPTQPSEPRPAPR